MVQWYADYLEVPAEVMAPAKQKEFAERIVSARPIS
jgi:hypothetical protein